MNGFGFDIFDDGLDDVNLGELRQWILMATSMHEAALQHTVLMLAEPDHDCNLEVESEDLSGMSEFEKPDVEAFFAYEESMLSVFKMVRQIMKQQGWPVVEADIIP